MKSWNCFILIFGLCISNGLAFGFLFKRHVETEPTIPSVSSTPNVETSDVGQQITPKQAKNWFANVDDVFRTMTNDFAKKAQQRLAQLEQSVFTNIQQEVNQFQPVITGMQNKTAKEIRKPDIYSAEDIIPLEANDLDTTDVVKPYDLSRDTIVNDRIAENQKSSGSQTIDPNAELIEINDKSPQPRYSEYDSATLVDLSGDTRVNDRIAEQQALSGIISVHPGAEIFDVDKNGKPISPIDNDVKSSKHQPNRIPQTKKSTGLKTTDSRTKLTEKTDKSAKYYDDDSTQLVDLSGDTRVNDRIAEQQALSGIISVHPGAEVFDVDVNGKPILPIDNDVESSEHQLNRIDQSAANLNRIVQPSTSGFVITEPDYELLDNSAKNSRNYYYYVPDTIQQVRVADLSRDTIVNDRIAEQQAASGMVMIDPEAEFIDNRRVVARPSTNHYRAAARVQKNIPRRDLSRDTVVNDRISQQQAASGLIRIDPDAELIDTGANNLNNMYYNYVPNTIDEYNRRKRTESWNQFYQRPVAQPVQPRIVYYSW